uniref:Peptidase M13 N-terminal domain-containing protein n=1 Tax=Glossina brevipalpis TaxID=37001 RepID=A0A1A9W6K0_9MUSC
MHKIDRIIIALVPSILALSMPSLTQAAVNNQTMMMSKPDFNTDFAKMILKRAKAAEISSMLDAKVNPCNDFYKYACGNWHHSNPAQLFGELMTDKFQMLSKALDRKMVSLLNSPKNGKDLILDKIKDFHSSCKNVFDNKEEYKSNLKNVYKEFGDFPFLSKRETETETESESEEQNSLQFNWWLTVAKIQNIYGKDILLAADVMGDLKNNSQPRIYIGAPDATISEGGSTKFVNIVQEIITTLQLRELFSLDKKETREIARKIHKLARDLEKGTTDERLGKSMESLLTEYNLKELKKKYEKTLDIEKFLEISLNTTELPDSIYVYDESYLENLVKVVNETEKDTITTYILWSLLNDYTIKDSDKEDLDAFCSDKTKTFFNKYIDRAIYEQYRSESAEREIFEVWDHIKIAFRNELMGDKLDWISNSTREYAVEKLAAMNLSINAYDEENFTEFYDSLQIDPKNYVVNIQNILRNEVDDNIFELNLLKTDKDEAQELSFTPAYSFLSNRISIPVSMLQPRFFWDSNYPQAIKYATLGYLIAHEMIHGFDDDGRTFDKNGNSREWWDEKSAYEFDSRRKCFQAQYHKYKFDGRHLPDSVLQSENIADNAGVKLAYSAYMNWLYSKRDSAPNIEVLETLPGLDFDNRQLFFINFAQVWCEDIQMLFRSHVAQVDTHAPGMYRVIGSLSNFQEFSWVFHCERNAPMDPEYKSIPIVYILAIVPGLMPWDSGYRFLSFCHVFGSVAPWCGSFVYHLFMNIERGESVYYTLLKLDMIGIWVTQSFVTIHKQLQSTSLTLEIFTTYPPTIHLKATAAIAVVVVVVVEEAVVHFKTMCEQRRLTDIVTR